MIDYLENFRSGFGARAAESQEYDDSAIQTHDILIIETPDTLADLRARDRRDLIDHQAAPLLEPIALARFDRHPEQRGRGRIGRERAKRHRE